MAAIAGAIITIRGLDLFSKPIQAAARGAQADMTRLERTINQNIKQASILRSQAALLPAGSGAQTTALYKAQSRESVASFKTSELAALKYSSSLDVLRGKMAAVAGQMSSVGLMMTATLTLPIVAAGAVIVNTSLQFEEAMRNIQSISRGTNAETAALGARFIALSTDITKTVASPLELADAFYEIQSAAFYGADAQKILEQTTKTATAGLADQKETAKATAMALHAYGAASQDVTHYTDVMMRAVDIGIFRFEDLTQQMGDFIAAAGMLGVPIEQAMAALTTMTKKGLPIDEAATSLNRLFTSFLKPSAKAKDAAASFGIELSAAHLKAVGFANAIREVMKKTGGAEGALAAIFPEMRSLRGIFALGSDDLRMFNSDLVQLNNAAGTVDTVFATQVQAWSAQLKNFKNNVTALALAFGNILMPILTTFLRENVTPLVKQLAALNDESKVSILRFMAITAAAGPLLIVLGQITTATASMLSIFNVFVKGFAPIGGILSAVSAPIGIIMLAFAALSITLLAFNAGYAAWSKNIFDMQNKLANLASGEGTLAAIATGIQAVYKSMANTEELNKIGESFGILKDTLNDLGADIAWVFGKFGFEIPTAGEFIGWLIREVATLSVGLIGLGEQFILAFAFAVDAVRSLGQPLVYIANLIISVAQLLGQLGVGFAAFAKGDMGGLDAATKRVDDLKETIVNSAKSIPNAFKNGISDFKDNMTQYDKLLNESAARTEKRILAINNLNLPAIVGNKLSSLPVAGPQLPGPAIGKPKLPWLSPITGRERDTSERSVRNLPGKAAVQATDQISDLEGAVGDLGSTSSKTKTKLDEMTTALSGLLDEGKKFSIGLFDFTGGTNGGGPLAPGAGGPFEAIYRIQDIAASATRGKGPDTDKWAAMYGLDPASAQEIVKKFQMGIFDPQVMQYVDTSKLIDIVKLEAAAKASQQALAEKLAADSGLAKDAFMSLLGMGKDKEGNVVVPDINTAGIRTEIKKQSDALPKDSAIAQSLIGIDGETAKTAANSTIAILLPAFDQSITDNAEVIGERGKAYWAKFEGGLISAAESSGVLYGAVEKMVLKSLGTK